jgi:hypothetical protein
VGRAAAVAGVTHFLLDVIPLERSLQLEMAFAQRDSLLHQTKLDAVHAAQEANWPAGHCHTSWYIDVARPALHMGQEREKLDIAERGKHTPMLGGEKGSAVTFVTQTWPLTTQLKQL